MDDQQGGFGGVQSGGAMSAGTGMSNLIIAYTVIAAIETNKGNQYRYPYSYRFL